MKRVRAKEGRVRQLKREDEKKKERKKERKRDSKKNVSTYYSNADTFFYNWCLGL